MSTNGLGHGTVLVFPSFNVSAERMSHMVKDAPTNTTPTTAQNKNLCSTLLLTAISKNLTELERLTGLLNLCNRDITERLKC